MCVAHPSGVIAIASVYGSFPATSGEDPSEAHREREENRIGRTLRWRFNRLFRH
jgi:hypothetical protein